MVMNGFSVTPGFHFEPRDSELINNFLLPKSTGQYYPSNVPYVVEKVLYGAANPWDVLSDVHWVSPDLDGDDDDTKNKQGSTTYVFTTNSKPSSSRCDRGSGCGSWKAQNTKDIIHQGKLIGFNKAFSFLVKSAATKNSAEDNYRWVMHEFSLPQDVVVNCQKNLVLCKIIRYEKKKRVKRSLMDDSQQVMMMSQYSCNKKAKTGGTSDIFDHVVLDQLQQEDHHVYMGALHNLDYNNNAIPTERGQPMQQQIQKQFEQDFDRIYMEMKKQVETGGTSDIFDDVVPEQPQQDHHVYMGALQNLDYNNDIPAERVQPMQQQSQEQLEQDINRMYMELKKQVETGPILLLDGDQPQQEVDDVLQKFYGGWSACSNNNLTDQTAQNHNEFHQEEIQQQCTS